ncbi:hypothetical protein HON71_00130 [Candidatus Woesearchaeota archaeon]|jgi:hypothetical protein|nr:hypothetical protein [Candidatus Woesearchaeota archaeon]MBT5343002.1 hypothetical protein [Candidatus Woesearchaeota archaeon]
MVNNLKTIEDKIKELESQIGKNQNRLDDSREKIRLLEKNDRPAIFWNIEKVIQNFNYGRIIEQDGFPTKCWGIYVVKDRKKDVLIREWDGNSIILKHYLFKKVFPGLVNSLNSAKRKELTILSGFIIGKKYSFQTERSILYDAKIPEVRIIKKSEKKRMKKRDNLEEKLINEQRNEIDEDNRLLNSSQYQRGYLNLIARTAQENIQIKKSNGTSLETKPFYSMWIENSPILLYSEENFHYLSTNRKDEPFEINLANQLTRRRLLKAVDDAKERVSFNEGDLITYSGIPIVGDNAIYASEIFQKVFTGIKILPRPEEPQGYQEKVENGKNEAEIVYRHWGQIYLSKLGPEDVNQGEILGSGGSYKAFLFFRNKLVVEFDQEDRATYLFDPESFNELRMANRSKLISENPEGFYGRVIHHENRELWKEQVEDFLTR